MKLNLFSRLMTPSDVRTCIGMAGILGAIACGMAAQGCSAVCEQMTAQAPAVNAKLADAQSALAQVESSGIRSQLSGGALAKFDAAMKKAQDAIVLANQAIALGQQACKDPSPYLAQFVAAWDVIRGFLALVGGHGTPVIADPIVWVEARS